MESEKKMEKRDPQQVPLKVNSEMSKNLSVEPRQRLAELIGKLLAKYWLKKQTPPTRSSPVPGDET